MWDEELDFQNTVYVAKVHLSRYQQKKRCTKLEWKAQEQIECRKNKNTSDNERKRKKGHRASGLPTFALKMF